MIDLLEGHETDDKVSDDVRDLQAPVVSVRVNACTTRFIRVPGLVNRDAAEDTDKADGNAPGDGDGDHGPNTDPHIAGWEGNIVERKDGALDEGDARSVDQGAGPRRFEVINDFRRIEDVDVAANAVGEKHRRTDGEPELHDLAA